MHSSSCSSKKEGSGAACRQVSTGGAHIPAGAQAPGALPAVSPGQSSPAGARLLCWNTDTRLFPGVKSLSSAEPPLCWSPLGVAVSGSSFCWQPQFKPIPPQIKAELDASPAQVEPHGATGYTPSPFLPPFPFRKQSWPPSFPSPYYLTVLPLFAKPPFILFSDFCISTPFFCALNAGSCRPPGGLLPVPWPSRQDEVLARSRAHQPCALCS